MKNRIAAFSRKKKVYYFDHRHGVLKKNALSRYNALSGLMSAVLIFGGLGFASVKALDLYRQHQNSPASLQRQSVAVDPAAQADENNNKLKDTTKAAREDKDLAKAIKSKLKNVPGGQKWSVYVRDLNSDRMASINADDMHDAGDLGNLFLLAPLEIKVSSDRWGYRYGKQQLAKCIEQMIKASDDDCTRLVRQYADLKNADSVNAGLGFKKTEISEKQLKTTARETGDLLFRLQNSQVLNDKARRVFFDGLYAQKSREGIPMRCDQGCLVGNATAEDNNIRHDAAIVTAGDSKYVVVIMTQGASWSQIADVASHIRVLFQP